MKFFQNGPEYEARLKKPFTPPTVTLNEIHDAVPKHLLKPDPWKSTSYLLRDITFTLTLYMFARSITPWSQSNFGGFVTTPWKRQLLKYSLWMTYWWFQGLVAAGLFCLGHDAGHGTLYQNKRLNNTVGYILHTFLLIPYFSWRSTHHAHHKATSSMERDENYVPYLRSEFNLPSEKSAQKVHYSEIFEETPFYTFMKLFVMQGFGWWIYLAKNQMGSKMYPPGTNHFNPYSPLFKDRQRVSILMSDVGLVVMLAILANMGPRFLAQYYIIPYFCSLYLVMFTFLHHSDPTMPHYRKEEWSFLRGATATVDRPLLGWMGRFFFHNISHDHVAHHFFIRAPFYNGPQITEAIKAVLKGDYNYDSTSSFYALYRSFTQCVFVEDEGNIIFYKNKHGVAARELGKSELLSVRD
ncbi:hypothetical protein AMATHDRAFT_193081 [Amanita thiersii Skay4041]|uniref:Fatty acid desaturase domain-containing protein n=1 Tax=Amanita thiersii Skay4041 TaxID=703135 RepID=A0A2A9NQG0_9AGAR|nr:hypothetical protein AMATHDRAFT_193081 [Amanita thiersii Skay4041]